MLIDYTFNTGVFADVREVNLEGGKYAGTFTVDADHLTVQASMNSQTLLETSPSSEVNGFGYEFANTGDFYVSGFEANFSSSLTGITAGNILYDVSQTGSGMFLFGNSGELQSGFMDMIETGVSGQISNPTMFLNGQKVYSGIEYQVSDWEYSWIGSIDVSGKMFAYSTDYSYISQYSTGGYDLTGQRFNKGSVNIYVNGMEQTDEVILAAGTVLPIQTGYASPPSGYLNSSTMEYVF